MDAGIHAAKLNASVGRKQIGASIGCSFNFCIQNVSISCNFCNTAKKMQAYMQPNELQVLNGEKLLPVCRIILCIQSNSSL